MTVKLRKFITVLLIGVVALSFCFAIPQTNGNLNKIFTTLMSDTVVYTVSGYDVVHNIETGVAVNVDLSGAKVADNLGTEYLVTSIALAGGGQTLPDGLALTANSIIGMPRAAGNTTITLIFAFTDAVDASLTVESDITFNISEPTEQLTYSLSGAITSFNGEVGDIIDIDLSGAKVVDSLNTEYFVTSIALAGGQALPDGLALSEKAITGTLTTEESKTVTLIFAFNDANTVSQTIKSNITFDIATPMPPLKYSLSGAPTNITCDIGSFMSCDLSDAKVADNLGTEYPVTSIALAGGQALPDGLTLSGSTIIGTPTSAVDNKEVTLQYYFTNAGGNAQTIDSNITFDINAIMQDVVFEEIPSGTFVYNMSNSISLNSISAKVNSQAVTIKEFICIGVLPRGLSLKNGVIDGKAQTLSDEHPVKFAAIFTNGERAYFNVAIKVSPQGLRNATLDIDSFEYNGQPLKPTISVFGQGGDLLSDNAYDIKFYRGNNITTDFIKAGAIRVEAVGKNNYGSVATQTYIIIQKAVDDSYVQNFEDVTYDGKAHQHPPIFVGYKENDYTAEYLRENVATADFTNVGEITIKITFNGNFKGQIIKKYSILAVTASVNDIVFAADVEFDGKSHIPAPKVDSKWKIGVDYLVTMLKDGSPAKDYIAMGEYLVKVDFINNVSGSFQQIFRILPQAITPLLSGTVNYVYDGQAKMPTTYLIGDYKLGIDYDLICYRGDNITTDYTSHGEIKVVATMKGNYSGRAEASYYIYPSSLAASNHDNINMSIASKNGFLLGDKFSVTKADSVSFKIRYGANEKLEYVLLLGMQNGGEKADLASLATVKVKTNISPKDIKGIRIEYFERDVQISKTAAIDSNGFIVFDIYSVGEIAIIVDYPSQNTIPTYIYFAIGGAVLLLILIIVVVIYFISKRTGVRTVMPTRRK